MSRRVVGSVWKHGDSVGWEGLSVCVQRSKGHILGSVSCIMKKSKWEKVRVKKNGRENYSVNDRMLKSVRREIP